MMRVAVVGGGQIAGKVYLPVLAAMAQGGEAAASGSGPEPVELAVLVEPAAERREALARAYRFGRAVAGVEELSAGEVDCAFLLTPEAVRRAPLTALLELGADVLCEKPLAQDLPQAEELAALAEKAGRILMVGFNRRFMPVYRKAREMIAGRAIDVCRAQKQGANLINHTIHMLDTLRFFCGDAVSVRADGNFEAGGAGKETLSAALIRFDSGALGIFETSARVGARLEEFEAHGDGFTVYVEAPHRAVLHSGGRELTYRPEQETWYVQSEQHYGFVEEIRHFLEAVASRRPPECAAADAVESHRLAFDILAEMRRSGGRPGGKHA